MKYLARPTRRSSSDRNGTALHCQIKSCCVLLALLMMTGCFAQVAEAQDDKGGGSLGGSSNTQATSDDENLMDKMRGVEEALRESSVGRYEKAYGILRKLRAEYPADRSLTKHMFEMMSIELKRKRNSSDTELLRQRYLEMADLARNYIQGANTTAETRKSMSQALVNEAVVFAIRKETDKCFESLKLASVWGFEDVRQLYLMSEFDELREMPKFKEVVGPKATEFEEEIFEYARNAIEKSSPFEFTMSGTTVDGEEFDFSKQIGKLVIVDLSGDYRMASDNLSKKNIPGFNKLAEKYADQKVQFVGIRFQKNENKRNKLAKDFRDKVSMEYPLIAGTRELIPKFRALNTLPALMIIDTKGNVRATLAGAIPMITLEAFLKLHVDGELETLVSKAPLVDGEAAADKGAKDNPSEKTDKSSDK